MTESTWTSMPPSLLVHLRIRPNFIENSMNVFRAETYFCSHAQPILGDLELFHGFLYLIMNYCMRLDTTYENCERAVQ